MNLQCNGERGYQSLLPLPPRTIVRYETWRTWESPEEGEQYIGYSIRFSDEPLPDDIQCPLYDDGRASFIVLEKIPDFRLELAAGEAHLILPEPQVVGSKIFTFKTFHASAPLCETTKLVRQIQETRL